MPLKAAQLAGLIETHAAALRLWIRRRCEASEDVVQDAFCRLAVEEPAPENPAAWLYRVCRNLAEKQRLSDQRRRQREATRSLPEASAINPTGGLELAEALEAVDELSDDLREVLIARIWGQLSLEEVAGLCGISTATAFRRYQSALEQLRSKLLPVAKEHS